MKVGFRESTVGGRAKVVIMRLFLQPLKESCFYQGFTTTINYVPSSTYSPFLNPIEEGLQHGNNIFELDAEANLDDKFTGNSLRYNFHF